MANFVPKGPMKYPTIDMTRIPNMITNVMFFNLILPVNFLQRGSNWRCFMSWKQNTLWGRSVKCQFSITSWVGVILWRYPRIVDTVQSSDCFHSRGWSQRHIFQPTPFSIPYNLPRGTASKT